LLQDGHDHVYVLRQQLVQSNGQVQQLHEKLNQAVEYGQQLQETLASSTAAQTALQKGVDTSKLLVARLLKENLALTHGLGMCEEALDLAQQQLHIAAQRALHAEASTACEVGPICGIMPVRSAASHSYLLCSSVIPALMQQLAGSAPPCHCCLQEQVIGGTTGVALPSADSSISPWQNPRVVNCSKAKCSPHASGTEQEQQQQLLPAGHRKASDNKQKREIAQQKQELIKQKQALAEAAEQLQRLAQALVLKDDSLSYAKRHAARLEKEVRIREARVTAVQQCPAHHHGLHCAYMGFHKWLLTRTTLT
jgi:hypothetical protein